MIHILLPVYNEEANLAAVIEDIARKLQGSDYRILVVNDGSTDATSAIIRELGNVHPVKELRFETNQGVGAVFRMGLTMIAEAAAETDPIITMDCDRTHSAADFPGLLEALTQGADMAVASRCHPQSRCFGLPLRRRLLSNGVALLLRVFMPVPGLKDYTTFFRAYRAGILRKCFQVYGPEFICQPGFSSVAEIAVKLGALSARITEVPVELRFNSRRGASKMKVMVTAREYLGLIIAGFRPSFKHKISEQMSGDPKTGDDLPGVL